MKSLSEHRVVPGSQPWEHAPSGAAFLPAAAGDGRAPSKGPAGLRGVKGEADLELQRFGAKMYE